MFVFDSFLYFRCEDGVTGPGVTWGRRLDPGPQFCSLNHTSRHQHLTKDHNFSPWTMLRRGLA